MIIRQIKSPILPRNQKDPTQSSRVIRRIFADIDVRYDRIRDIINGRLSRYQVQKQGLTGNASNDGSDYIYSIPPNELGNLFEFINSTLQDQLLDGMIATGGDNWFTSYLDEEYQRGTQFSMTNLAAQSAVYQSATNIHMLMSSPGYINQVQTAKVRSYSDWKGVSDRARADLSNVIAEAIAKGDNVRDTAAVIEARLSVSKTQARTIAQTEQLGAYRQAQRNETVWASERLGLHTGMLHLSALLPTSRVTHVERHGMVFTPEEVEVWYSEDGNRYNCHCTQIPVILDEHGNIVNEGMVNKLAAARVRWIGIAKAAKK